MPNFSDTILQLALLKSEASFGTVPTFASSNYCAIIEANAIAKYANDRRPDKTGSYAQPRPVAGDQTATWSLKASLAPSGVAGTAPDIGPVLKAAFGAETISAGVSVTYAPSTSVTSFSMGLVDFPSTVDQKIATGCIPDNISLDLSGDSMPIISASGPCKWVIRKSQFASLTTAEKGGLSSFAAWPGSPVFNGFPVPKRRGIITLDGNVYDTFKTGQFAMPTGKSLSSPAWGSNLARDIQNTTRQPAFTFSLDNDDSANLAALIVKARTKAIISTPLVIGTVAGSILTINLPGGTLEMPEDDYSNVRGMLKFAVFLSESANGAGDDVSWVLT